jgi:hypothetical protein
MRPVVFFVIEFEQMEIVTALIVLGCLSSPVLFIICVWLGFLYFRDRKALQQSIQRYESKILTISRSAQNAMRESWLVEVKNIVFNSELEVESKFVYPMLRYLGYGPSDLKMRVSVGVRVGRQNVTGIADWVAYRGGKPVLVIEAKEKNQNLNGPVQEQARSYCFALNCQLYLLTNGRQIQVFRRGVDGDSMVFSSHVDNLSENWGKLNEIIGAAPAQV